MKRACVAAAVIAILAGSQALAQTAIVEISPDQRAKIKAFVMEGKVKPVSIPERLTVGSTIPGDIELTRAPVAWGSPANQYDFVYTGGHVVLVDPANRQVVQILD